MIVFDMFFEPVNLLTIGSDPKFLPKADCKNCKYSGKFDDQHCYMFKTKPGDKCGQFKEKN